RFSESATFLSPFRDNERVLTRSRIHRTWLIAGILLLVGGFAGSGPVAGAVDELSWIALALAILVFAAKLGGEVAVRIGQPAVVGEILAGVLLGNLPGLETLHWFATDTYLDVLA